MEQLIITRSKFALAAHKADIATLKTLAGAASTLSFTVREELLGIVKQEAMELNNPTIFTATCDILMANDSASVRSFLKGEAAFELALKNQDLGTAKQFATASYDSLPADLEKRFNVRKLSYYLLVKDFSMIEKLVALLEN